MKIIKFSNAKILVWIRTFAHTWRQSRIVVHLVKIVVKSHAMDKDKNSFEIHFV